MAHTKLYNLLPKHFRELDREEELKRFCEVFQDTLDNEDDNIRNILNLFDVDNCPDEFLEYLAQHIGLEYSKVIDAENLRATISNIVDIYKVKGTETSIINYVKLMTGWDALVSVNQLEKVPMALGKMPLRTVDYSYVKKSMASAEGDTVIVDNTEELFQEQLVKVYDLVIYEYRYIKEIVNETTFTVDIPLEYEYGNGNILGFNRMLSSFDKEHDNCAVYFSGFNAKEIHIYLIPTPDGGEVSEDSPKWKFLAEALPNYIPCTCSLHLHKYYS